MELNQGAVTVVGKKEKRILVAGLVIHVAGATKLFVCHRKGMECAIASNRTSMKFDEHLVGLSCSEVLGLPSAVNFFD